MKSEAEVKQRAVRHSNGMAKFSKGRAMQSLEWQEKGEGRMICEGCKRYRGMKDGMVRCWDSQMFLLTSIPVASMRRKKECPKWTKRRGSKT